MIKDEQIKKDVEEELKWDPSIDPTDIAVKVNQGVVGLSGYVSSYIDKFEAEIATKRINGVHGVANDLVVKLPSSSERPDPELAREAVSTLKGQLPTCWDKIKVLVKNGSITLEGFVDWHYQRDIAERIVHRLTGVKEILNRLTLRPHASTKEIKNRIISAFHRNAQIDAENIQIAIDGSEITLTGSVRTWAERNEAQRSAWAAPGVSYVHNKISIL